MLGSFFTHKQNSWQGALDLSGIKMACQQIVKQEYDKWYALRTDILVASNTATEKAAAGIGIGGAGIDFDEFVAKPNDKRWVKFHHERKLFARELEQKANKVFEFWKWQTALGKYPGV